MLDTKLINFDDRGLLDKIEEYALKMDEYDNSLRKYSKNLKEKIEKFNRHIKNDHRHYWLITIAIITGIIIFFSLYLISK